VVSPTSPTSRDRQTTVKKLIQEGQGTKDLAQGSRNIIYFIVGAALESMLALAEEIYVGIDKEETMNKLRSNLAYPDGVVGATNAGMPCTLVQRRSLSNLLYPKMDLYNVFLNMESNVFMPMMKNVRMLACLGNFHSVYIERELQCLGYPEAVMSVIENALGVISSSTDMTTTTDEDEGKNKFSRILSEKMFRYFSGSMLNDFLRFIVRSLKQDLNFQKSVAFRQIILTKKLLKQLNDEKAKVKKIKKKNKKNKNKKKKKECVAPESSCLAGGGTSCELEEEQAVDGKDSSEKDEDEEA
jgi:hypothetical protein